MAARGLVAVLREAGWILRSGKKWCKLQWWPKQTVDGSEILNNHLGCINPCKQCDIYHINWWSPDFWTINRSNSNLALRKFPIRLGPWGELFIIIAWAWSGARNSDKSLNISLVNSSYRLQRHNTIWSKGNYMLGGGFKHLLCSPRQLGKMIQFWPAYLSIGFGSNHQLVWILTQLFFGTFSCPKIFQFGE